MEKKKKKNSFYTENQPTVRWVNYIVLAKKPIPIFLYAVTGKPK